MPSYYGVEGALKGWAWLDLAWKRRSKRVRGGLSEGGQDSKGMGSSSRERCCEGKYRNRSNESTKLDWRKPTRWAYFIWRDGVHN